MCEQLAHRVVACPIDINIKLLPNALGLGGMFQMSSAVAACVTQKHKQPFDRCHTGGGKATKYKYKKKRV